MLCLLITMLDKEDSPCAVLANYNVRQGRVNVLCLLITMLEKIVIQNAFKDGCTLRWSSVVTETTLHFVISKKLPPFAKHLFHSPHNNITTSFTAP